jgi:enediyne biosynthesis protein E4
VSFSRRNFISAGISFATAAAFGQGVATPKVTPQPRGKLSGVPFNAQFKDVAVEAGLTEICVYGGVDHKNYIIETIGCGCAFIDYDNDGWLDIILLSGARLDQKSPGSSIKLYKNNRNGTFTETTKQAGLYKEGWACGICVADYNNDGFDDFFVTYWGQNALYRNNGDGTFTDVTRPAGLLDDRLRWATGCTFFDYNRDGHLDLFVSNYLQFDLATATLPGQTPNCKWHGIPVNCGPRGFPFGQHSLYRNNGDGTFSDVSKAAGISNAKGSYGLTVVAADFDDDGWPDIYVACDSSPSLLFLNNHNGTFREEGVLRGLAYNEDGQEQAGMGLGIGDYDLDGRIDIFKTHFAEDTNALYRNLGHGEFEDVTKLSGLGVETRYVSWGAGIIDLDNDGLPDLFSTSGHVYPEAEAKDTNFPLKTPRVVFRNLGNGRFEELMSEAGPGVVARHNSRGCAFGDFDNDGDLDILIVNLNEPPSLLRNDLQGNASWLKVKLIGTKSNRSAIGSRVLIKYGGRQQAQELLSQSSFCSTNDSRLHFGLGTAKSADLTIHWPSGLREEFRNCSVNRLLVIKEGTGILH